MWALTLQFAKEFNDSNIFAIEETDYAYQKLKTNVNLNTELSTWISCTQTFITNKINKSEEVYLSREMNANKNKHSQHFGIKESTSNANIIFS